MPVVLLIVGLVVLIAVVYAATGRGGALSAERADYAPLDLGPVSATDIALLRPPSAAWGYDMQVTDKALGHIADSIRERDVRIVALEQLVTDLSRSPDPVPIGDPFPGARHRRGIEAPGTRVPGIQASGAQVPGSRGAAIQAEGTQAAGSRAPAWPELRGRTEPQARTEAHTRTDLFADAEAPTADLPAVRPPAAEAPASTSAPAGGQSLPRAAMPDPGPLPARDPWSAREPQPVRERGGQPERPWPQPAWRQTEPEQPQPQRQPEPEREPQPLRQPERQREPQPEHEPQPQRQWQPQPQEREQPPPERSHD